MTYAGKYFFIIILNSAENMGMLLWKTLCLGFLVETDKPEVFQCCFLMDVSRLTELALDLCL